MSQSPSRQPSWNPDGGLDNLTLHLEVCQFFLLVERFFQSCREGSPRIEAVSDQCHQSAIAHREHVICQSPSKLTWQPLSMPEPQLKRRVCISSRLIPKLGYTSSVRNHCRHQVPETERKEFWHVSAWASHICPIFQTSKIYLDSPSLKMLMPVRAKE